MFPEKRFISSTILISFLMVSMYLLPEAAGDGAPLYPTYQKAEEEVDLYGSTYESRQLASVEVLNSTHQRIDLFLSIFSLDPGNNLTVIVPFRELPLDVSIR